MTPEGARSAHQELKHFYDDQLAQAPNDASLLYLRGRLEDHIDAGAPYYAKALAAEPQHPYALYASSHSHFVAGEFEVALRLLRQAIAAKPGDIEFEAVLNRMRLAARDFESLEASVREELKRKPLDTESMGTLLKLLILTDRAADADREIESFVGTSRQQASQFSNSLAHQMKCFLAEIKGEFAKLEELVASRGDPVEIRFDFIARLGLDKLAAVPPDTNPLNAEYWNLCRELISRRVGDDDQAAAARKAALNLFDQGSSHDWYVADTLRRSTNITWEEIAELIALPNDKAVVLVLLARERTDLRSRLLDLAEKLNFDLEFPYYVVKREIDDMRK